MLSNPYIQILIQIPNQIIIDIRISVNTIPKLHPIYTSLFQRFPKIIRLRQLKSDIQIHRRRSINHIILHNPVQAIHHALQHLRRDILILVGFILLIQKMENQRNGDMLKIDLRLFDNPHFPHFRLNPINRSLEPQSLSGMLRRPECPVHRRPILQINLDILLRNPIFLDFNRIPKSRILDNHPVLILQLYRPNVLHPHIGLHLES